MGHASLLSVLVLLGHYEWLLVEGMLYGCVLIFCCQVQSIHKNDNGDKSSKGGDKTDSAGRTCIHMALVFNHVQEEDN